MSEGEGQGRMGMGVEQTDRGGLVIECLYPFAGIGNEGMQRVRRYVAHGDIVLDVHAARCVSTQQYAASFMRVTGQQMLPQHELYGAIQSDGLGFSWYAVISSPLSLHRISSLTESSFFER